MDNFGWVLVGMVVFFIGGAILISAFDRDERLKCERVLAQMGYEPGDIDAFVNVTDFTRRNLIVSPAARKQFERFLNGEQMTIKKTHNTSTTVIMPISTGR